VGSNPSSSKPRKKAVLSHFCLEEADLTSSFLFFRYIRQYADDI